MEELELHPVNTRVVCLNQPQLRLMWVFKALAAKLGCYYNHHLLQVISSQATIQLPSPKTVKLRGHTSHRFSTDVATMNTTLQTATYVMFYMPDDITNNMQSNHLILNGIESVTKADNPTKAVIQIVNEGVSVDNLRSDRKQIPASNVPNNDQECESCPAPTRAGSKSLEIEFDFKNCESIETLVEEEENIDSADDSDCSDDLHKVIRHRLSIDISSLMDEWRRLRKNEVCVLLLKPAHECQSWQFKSLWISTALHCDKENLGSQQSPRKTNITRKKPVSSPDCLGTLNTKRKANKQQGQEYNTIIQLKAEPEISVS